MFSSCLNNSQIKCIGFFPKEKNTGRGHPRLSPFTFNLILKVVLHRYSDSFNLYNVEPLRKNVRMLR